MIPGHISKEIKASNTIQQKYFPKFTLFLEKFDETPSQVMDKRAKKK